MKLKLLLTLVVLYFFTSCEKENVPTTSIQPKITFNKIILGSWVNYQSRMITGDQTQWPSWSTMVEEKYYYFKSDLTYNYYTLGVNFSNSYDYNSTLKRLRIQNSSIIKEYEVISFSTNEFVLQQNESAYKVQSRFIRRN